MNRKEKIMALVEKVSDMDYGSVITYAEIGDLIKDRRGTSSFSDVVQTARRELINVGHMIENVRDVGYMVVQPDNYTNCGARLVKAGALRIDRGVRIMQHAPVSKMSVPALEAHNRAYDSMMNLQAAMSGATVQIHMLAKQRSHPLLEMK